MSVEQVVFAVAGAVCVIGVVIAVTHRDPRVAGVALGLTLLALAALCAGLGAPAVAAALIVVALFATAPLARRPIPAPFLHSEGGPVAGGAALLLGAAIGAILIVAIALGELQVNRSVRSSDGDDLAALLDLLSCRASVVIGGSAVLLASAAAAMVAAWRDRRVRP
jgi:hypothetical protein